MFVGITRCQLIETFDVLICNKSNIYRCASVRNAGLRLT